MLVVRATTEMTALHKGLRYPVVDTYLTKMAIYSGQPQFVQNYSQSAQRLKIHDPYHLSAVANTPLVINDRVIGVFALGRTESHIPFTDDDIRIMVLISQLAALAIDNAQLFDMAEHELMERKRTENELRLVNQKLQFQLEQIQSLQLELREQAIRDPLTGLYNRRYLKEILDHELASAERESYPISFVMMDIDHFKKINDTFGHNTGDLILQNLANQLLSQARVGDIICRYGGEEILAVLPNVSIETAYQITERWRISFEDSKQTLTVSRENVETRATISCGISTFPFNGSTRDELIYAADMAMYKAKEMGRNQTIIWQNNST
jgi:diguanylate cyclase (GGDEF)-like protein